MSESHEEQSLRNTCDMSDKVPSLRDAPHISPSWQNLSQTQHALQVISMEWASRRKARRHHFRSCLSEYERAGRRSIGGDGRNCFGYASAILFQGALVASPGFDHLTRRLKPLTSPKQSLSGCQVSLLPCCIFLALTLAAPVGCNLMLRLRGRWTHVELEAWEAGQSARLSHERRGQAMVPGGKSSSFMRQPSVSSS